MPPAPKPTRRRLQFSMGTMLVVVTVVAIFIAYHVNWIRQRHQVLEMQRSGRHVMSVPSFDGPPSAPGMLWLFREPGHSEITVSFFDTRPDRPATYGEGDDPTPEQLAEGNSIRRLFPEADLRVYADASVNRRDAPLSE